MLQSRLLSNNRPVETPARFGFSLVELLVVIGVIALLLGLALPALNRARSAASSVACLSNSRQLTQAALTYAVDHKNVWVGWHPDTDRKQLLYPYLEQGRSNDDLEGEQVWHCPDNAEPETAAGYGSNTNLNWERVTRIARPSATVAFTDAGINDEGEPILATHVFPPSATSFDNIGRPNPRHGSESEPTVNVAYADGSGESHLMQPPFYGGPPGQWTGNGITDKSHDDYADELWDLR